MNDLLNLDFDTKSAPSVNKGKSAFEYLAATSSHHSTPVQSPLFPPKSPATSKPASTAPSPSNTSQDAFSSLFDGQAKTSASHTALPMAQRLAATSGPSTPSFPASRPRTPLNPAKPIQADVWDFDMLAPSAPKTKAPSFTARNLSDQIDKAAAAKVVHNKDDSFDLAFDDIPPVSTTEAVSAVASGSRPPSPPPHILGQLVEMGFAIPDARNALNAAYDSSTKQWDLQAATEAIIASKVPDEDEAPISLKRSSELPQQGSNGRHSIPDRSEERIPSRRLDPAKAEDGLVQADLLAQASQISMTVFKTANTYWKTGRKAVQKAIDERVAPKVETVDDRPKWMRSLPPESTAERSQDLSIPPISDPRRKIAAPEQNLFHDQDELPQRSPSNGKSIQLDPVKASEAKVYQSSARRKVPPRSGASTPLPQPSLPIAAAKSSTVIGKRRLIQASSGAISSSSAARSRGNEHFKLGRYGEAESAYTQAIDSLPPQHLARLQALNNRAAARLKSGEARSAAVDATAVLVLIYDREEMDSIDCVDLDKESRTSDGLNLREAVGKALAKRAQAREALEQYESALADWELLLRAGDGLHTAAGGARLISDGVQRAKRALQPKSKPVVHRPAKRRPPSPPIGSSGAVQHLRQVAHAKESEDAQRLQLKDSVDLKIAAWKGGKEANLRALVASLDSVLWPELHWKTVGMHELISDSKLKINYMKAIAKLHPDKLNSENTTLEQRMIASYVFSALNDAWNAKTT